MPGLESKGAPPCVVPSIWTDFFYWLTVFESLDGFEQSVYETGSISMTPPPIMIELSTGSTVDSIAEIGKRVALHAYADYDLFSWDREQRLRLIPEIVEATNQLIWLIHGELDASEHIGFKVVNSTLYGTVGNGSTETTLNLGTLSAGDTPWLEAVLKPGVECRFWVNGEDKGAITEDLPTGDSNAELLMRLHITNTAAEDKIVRLSFWEIYAVR